MAERTERLRWHRTTLDGRVVVYGEAGDGPPAVFLHGWGLSSRAYEQALPGLLRAGVRVIAPALPGFGRSAPLPGELRWDALARWADHLLDHLVGSEPAFLIGHSFGGGVATATAYHHPERVRSLVLINAVGGGVWKHGARGRRHLAERPLWHWLSAMPREFAAREYLTTLPRVARVFVDNALRDPRRMVELGLFAGRADLRDELAEVARREIPVTVLWGDQDRVMTEDAFRALCESAGLHGQVIPDADHSWLLADPDAFGEYVTNSLTIHAMLDRRRAGRGA